MSALKALLPITGATLGGLSVRPWSKAVSSLERASFAMRRGKAPVFVKQGKMQWDPLRHLNDWELNNVKTFFPMLEGKSVKWEGKDRKVWMD